MSWKKTNLFTLVGVLVTVCLALSACSQMEPAKKAIADIEAAVAAAGDDAQRYVPRELTAVKDQLAALKAKFDEKDYKGVIDAAPALLARAQGLVAQKNQVIEAQAARAAARKLADELALKSDWATLSSAAPAAITAVQERLDTLTKAKKLPSGVTKSKLASAQDELAQANTLWQQAMSAQTQGNLQDAINNAKQAKQQAETTLASLGA
jgi:hypothetical protein